MARQSNELNSITVPSHRSSFSITPKNTQNISISPTLPMRIFIEFGIAKTRFGPSGLFDGSRFAGGTRDRTLRPLVE